MVLLVHFALLRDGHVVLSVLIICAHHSLCRLLAG